MTAVRRDDMAEPLVARAIAKSFGATRALGGVDFDLRAGECHALVGENGAGKSTLIRILSGVMQADAGIVHVGGSPVHFAGPRDAMAAGIVTIPQELRLVPTATVAENIMLGQWPTRGGLMVRRRRARQDAADALAAIGIDLPLDAPVRALGFAERQLTVIAKALRLAPRVLILDEPTAALEQREVALLFAVIARLKAEGVSILYVSHRLPEIVMLADRCTIMRDGGVVEVASRGSFDVPFLVAHMSGRALAGPVARDHGLGEPVLEAGETAVRGGEVVGAAGLLGSGARELVTRLFGLAGGTEQAKVGGATRALRSPKQAMRAGIGLVPGERAQGLVMSQSIRENIALPNLSRLGRPWWIGRSAGDRLTRRLIEALDIRPRNPALPVRALSGGNQQKVIFAKWLAREVELLLLDEPTHGIDVLAKQRLHAEVRAFAAGGGGVLMHSTDAEELLGLCDSILAIKAGRLHRRLAGRDGADEKILQEAIG